MASLGLMVLYKAKRRQGKSPLLAFLQARDQRQQQLASVVSTTPFGLSEEEAKWMCRVILAKVHEPEGRVALLPEVLR